MKGLACDLHFLLHLDHDLQCLRATFASTMRTLQGDNLYNDPQVHPMLTEWHINEEYRARSPL